MNSSIWSRTFWKATAERAVSSGAQFALLAWGGGTLPAVSLPWWTVPAAFAGGVVATTLKCLAASTRGDGGPGFTSAEELSE